MINRVVLVGRLARDPNELRSSANGTKMISFTIAVDKYSSKEDAGADFISCTAFNRNAEVVESYFRKGLLVGLEGRISTRSYEKNGETRYVTEVVCDRLRILESKSASGSRESYDSTRSSYRSEPEEYVNPTENSTDLGIDEDDLPF